MKLGFTRLMASAVMVAMPVAATAAASAPVVTAVAVSGNAFVARDGIVVPLKAGQGLRAGDRVMTRAGSSVKLSNAGCQRGIGATSAMTVGTSCAASVASANLSQVGTYDDDEAGVPFSHYIVGLLAAIAVGLGIYVAFDTETDDAPVSV